MFNKLITTLSLALLLVSCAEHNVGSRRFPVQITTTINNTPQPGATVFVVKNEDWIRWERKGISLGDPQCRAFLEPYKVTEGKTPITISDVSYQLVVIVEWNGKLIKARDTVVPGEQPTINVELQ